jgi:plasmid stabilization system protein ParE
MRIWWTVNAADDVHRLHLFLASVAPEAAVQVIRSLTAAPDRLLGYPRLGAPVDGFEPRDVRRLIVGRYEMRYEVRDDEIVILRIWHGRERRV